MDKKTGHILSAVVAAAVVGGLFRQNAALQGKVDQLSQQMSSLSNQLVDTRYDLSDEIGTLRRDLEDEASLFSTVETELGYENGALTLAVTVVPKELSAGETAQVSLSTGETAVLTDDGTGRLSGVLTCSLRDSLEPVVSLTAGDQTRREILPTLWTNELFTLKGDSDWTGGVKNREDLLSITLYSPENSALEVERVTVEVRSAILEVVEGVLVDTVEAVRQDDGSWQADIRNFIEDREEYNYDFWIAADTKEGITLRSDNGVASCEKDGTSSGWGSGSFSLFADFGEA